MRQTENQRNPRLMLLFFLESKRFAMGFVSVLQNKNPASSNAQTVEDQRVKPARSTIA